MLGTLFSKARRFGIREKASCLILIAHDTKVDMILDKIFILLRI